MTAPNAHAPQPSPTEVHPEPSPELEAEPGWGGDSGFGRVALLDTDRALAGWEVEVHAAGFDALMAPALALRDACGHHTVVWLRASLETLEDERLERFHAPRTVLQFVPPPDDDPESTDLYLAAAAACRRRGFRIALGMDMLTAQREPLLAQVDILKLQLKPGDTGAEPQLQQAAQLVRRRGLTLLVADIHTREQQMLASELGARWFAGSWFIRPPTTPRSALQAGHANLLELIGLVRREAELAEIEAVLRRDPVLAFRFLRLINHVGSGLQTEISSFGHAVMIMGLRKLLRWCCMLIATDPGGVAPAIGHTAIVRGRIMELLAEELLATGEGESAFLTGLFSLLDTMTGLPFDRALRDLSLPPAALDALRSAGGPLQPLLAMAIACEGGDALAYERARQALALPAVRINRAQLQALAWTDELLGRR